VREDSQRRASAIQAVICCGLGRHDRRKTHARVSSGAGGRGGAPKMMRTLLLLLLLLLHGSEGGTRN
jgi:hypothetical protein